MIISAASDYRAAAQRILPPFLFHYLDGGAYARVPGGTLAQLKMTLGMLDPNFKLSNTIRTKLSTVQAFGLSRIDDGSFNIALDQHLAERVQAVAGINRDKARLCVQANADLKGLHIECRDLILNGKASGDLLCSGVCKIKADQHISGTFRARRLTVEKKTAVLVTGGVHVENAWIQGTLEGALTAEGTVTIHRHAKFLGDITARRLVIEEGGIHQGSLTRLS